MKLKTILLGVLALTISGVAFAQSQYYCNPLPMPVGQGGYARGDVTVLEDNGTYYMICSGGGAWVSKDLVNWDFHQVEHVPGAPDLAKYNGKFYMTGNTDHVWVSDNPLGPYTDLGVFKNTGPVENGWNGGFDTKIFVDDDNTPYLFWPGRGISGIYGVRLDPNDLTKFIEKPTHLFGFNSMHWWERYGEMNEYPGVAWIEGPWVIKRNGVYYLEYSASGTQWLSYAEGYYTATSPLGPYTYAPNNPLLYRTDGTVTGPAHGSIVKGPDGEWWQFYTIVFADPTGGRRIGMDKVTFDEDGLMYCKVTDTPQPGPLAKVNKDVPSSVPVTIRKMTAMNALSKASSAIDGFPASFGVDNYTGTVWRPAADDKQPSIMIELSPATRFDVVQTFTVNSFRVLFESTRSSASPLLVYKYKLEVSNDGKTFKTVVDKTNNAVSRDVIFETFTPVERCRFVKLTITDWPKTGPLGIIDFTAFGYSDGYEPAAVATPVFSNLPLDREYRGVPAETTSKR